LFRGVREEAWKNFERRRREFQRDTSIKRGAMQDALDSMQSLLTGRTKTLTADWNAHQRPMAIIFIDEIDALAKRRDSGGLSSSLGGCDEREQTLNQLLIEMDGFTTGAPSQNTQQEGPSGVTVIVIAATNRMEVLDPAVLRAGRFDRHVQVPLPDADGREAILRIHARHIRYDPSSVNFRELADGKPNGNTAHVAPTHNFSGADLKNVINEAALLAVRSGSSCVKQQHLIDAANKVRATTDRSHGGGHHYSPQMHQWFVR
jgi:cell division protease FtsH